jgi:hypothetical protein
MDTPQLVRGHPQLIEFSSSLIKLEYYVNLGCLHLHRENQNTISYDRSTSIAQYSVRRRMNLFGC